MNSAQAHVAFTPVGPLATATSSVGAPSEQGSTERAEPRWMRDLLVLQVTSIFSAGLFMAIWFTH